MWLSSENLVFKNTLLYPTFWKSQNHLSPEGSLRKQTPRIHIMACPLSILYVISDRKLKSQSTQVSLFENLKNLYPPKWKYAKLRVQLLLSSMKENWDFNLSLGIARKKSSRYLYCVDGRMDGRWFFNPLNFALIKVC